MRLKQNGWLIAKLVLVLFCLWVGASAVSDLRAEDMPPLWIAPLTLLLSFIMGLLGRFASRTPPWTEQELWLANPFRYVFKFRDSEKVYYPPFLHLGAFTFIADGVSGLAYATFFRPETIGFAAIICAMGTGCWVGLRVPDILKNRKSQRPIAIPPKRTQ